MNYRIRQPILFAVVMGIGMAELAFALQTTSENPVLCTPIVRRHFNNEGKLSDTHGPEMVNLIRRGVVMGLGFSNLSTSL